ncbi:MAG: type IV pilus assembly protein PilM [Mariprofundales bacterium]
MRLPQLSSGDTGLVGIDLGATTIKLVELAQSDAGFEVAAYASVPMPRDTMVENEVLDSMLFADAVAELIDQAQPSTNRVAIAIGGSSVFNKIISLPYAEEFDLELTIQATAAEYIPFALDEVYLDFFILGPQEDEPDTMDVVLVACKREVVDDLQLVLLDAGLELAVVDCAPFALENAAELVLNGEKAAQDDEDDGGDEEEASVVALVNIGAQMMNVNIVRDGKSQFVRDHFFGGERLTLLLQEASNISYVKAEQEKLAGAAIPDEVRDQFLDELEAEIMRSIDIYTSAHADYPVNRILLTGGAALLPGLVDAMQDRLGVDAVTLLDTGSSLIFSDDDGFTCGAEMTTAVGLALRAFG